MYKPVDHFLLLPWWCFNAVQGKENAQVVNGNMETSSKAWPNNSNIEVTENNQTIKHLDLRYPSDTEPVYSVADRRKLVFIFESVKLIKITSD